MWKEIRKTITIAHITVLESIRRKDPYVVLILGAAMVLGAGLFSRFGVEGLEKFVKDVGFTVTTVFSIIICVVATARQLPGEIQNRTLYPSLGKPVSRANFYLGKYVGVSLMSSAVVAPFFGVQDPRGRRVLSGAVLASAVDVVHRGGRIVPVPLSYACSQCDHFAAGLHEHADICAQHLIYPR